MPITHSRLPQPKHKTTGGFFLFLHYSQTCLPVSKILPSLKTHQRESDVPALTLNTDGPTPNPLNVSNNDRSVKIVNNLNQAVMPSLSPAGFLNPSTGGQLEVPITGMERHSPIDRGLRVRDFGLQKTGNSQRANRRRLTRLIDPVG
jgi:hypothetical protein